MCMTRTGHSRCNPDMCAAKHPFLGLFYELKAAQRIEQSPCMHRSGSHNGIKTGKQLPIT